MVKLPDISDKPDDANAARLLAALAGRGIVATLADGRLVIDAPAGSFGPDLQADVRRHRDAIIRRLTDGAARWIERIEADGGRSWTRIDMADMKIIDLPPCSQCSSLDRWQDLAGGWHCATCQPHSGHGGRLREMAERLRQR